MMQRRESYVEMGDSNNVEYNNSKDNNGNNSSGVANVNASNNIIQKEITTRSQMKLQETKEAILREYGSIFGNKIIDWLNGDVKDINLIPSKRKYNPTWNNGNKKAIRSQELYNVNSSAPDGDCAYHSIFNATNNQHVQIFARYNMEGKDGNRQTQLDNNNHVQRMRNDVLCAILNGNLSPELQNNLETKRQTLDRCLSKDWAEEPEIAILGWLYALNINLWVDHDANTIKVMRHYPRNIGSKINLYYRNVTGEGKQNHYDWLEKAPNPTGSMMMPLQASGAEESESPPKKTMNKNTTTNASPSTTTTTNAP